MTDTTKPTVAQALVNLTTTLDQMEAFSAETQILINTLRQNVRSAREHGIELPRTMEAVLLLRETSQALMQKGDWLREGSKKITAFLEVSTLEDDNQGWFDALVRIKRQLAFIKEALLVIVEWMSPAEAERLRAR